MLIPNSVTSDDERTVARWLIQMDGDVNAVARAAGMTPLEIRTWAHSLPDRSEVKQAVLRYEREKIA